MPISVCLVSREPYLGVLKGCLTRVFPQLLANPTEMIGILEELMADLSCVPVPPPGGVALGFSLQPSGASAGERYHDPSGTIICQPPPHTDLPVIDVPVRLLFLKLSLEDMLLIVTALLTERRLIVLSKDYALLTPAIEAILALLYPFKWRHVYIPLVPAHMLAFVGAPWPFLIGIHSRYADRVLEEMPPSLGPVIMSGKSNAQDWWLISLAWFAFAPRTEGTRVGP